MERLLLDACVAINLIASGIRLDEVARSVGTGFAMTSVAAAETLFLAPDGAGGKRTAADLGAFPIDIIELAPDELSTFVELASQVDDGEAATLAVAIHRGLNVATDDRRGARVAKERGIRVVTTASIMRSWADNAAPAARAVAVALDAIGRRASFVPRRSDPDYGWWCNAGDAQD